MSPLQRWLLAVIGVLLALFAFQGRLHPDEGFYVLTGAGIWQGKLPFLDYLYVQTPLAPFFLAVPPGLGAWQLFAGRLWCALWAIAFLGVTWRFVEPKARGQMLLLWCLSPFFLAYMATMKLYAPAAFLMGVAGLMLATERALPSLRVIIAAGSLVAVVILMRVSVLPGLALPLWLAWRRRGMRGAGAALGVWGGILVAGLLPFWLSRGEVLSYTVFAYQFDKDVIPWSRYLFYRLLTVKNLGLHYAALWALGGWAVWRVGQSGELRNLRESRGMRLALFMAPIIVAHLPNKKATLDAHLTLLFPVAALAVSFALARVDAAPRKLMAGLAALGLFVTAEQLHWRGLLPTRFQQMATALKQANPNRLPVASYHQALPVGLGMPVPRGYEMNTIHFGDEWSPEQCKEMMVLHHSVFTEKLRRHEVVVVSSETTFSHDFPKFRPLPQEMREKVQGLLLGCREAATARGMGYFGEDVTIYAAQP